MPSPGDRGIEGGGTEGSGTVRATLGRWRQLTATAEESGRRVLVAASFTANPIAPALGVTIADSVDDGRPPTIRFADYNQIFQVCLQPDLHGATDEAAHDVVLMWRIEDVFERDFHAWGNADPAAIERLVEGVAALGAAVRQLAEHRQQPVIVTDAPVPVGFGLDHRDTDELADLASLQHRLNSVFDAALAGSGVERLRLSALQLAHGSLASFDRRTWVMARQPFSDRFAHAVGRAIGEVIDARRRVPPKVLVLDCDDTLWGGTLVDDGVGGVKCSDAFPGFAYRSFQIAAQRLRHRGVLLAIASKNDDDHVRAAFAGADGMVLTDADLAGRRVAWTPKPDSLASLAAEFNLALDSFVFVDDSDYELGAVATQTPDVRTLRVPDDIEELPDLLAESGWFRSMRVTSDDLARTERMLAESERVAASTSMSHSEFLLSLGLRVQVIDASPHEVGRITQLINKTNQFNLTTIRRSEGEVAGLLDDPATTVLAFAVDDRFGDYGVVGVTITHTNDGVADLDTVLMSCRVLGRGVETAILAATTERARASGAQTVTGTYRATDRNGLVADLLPRHGFEPTGDDGRYALAPERHIDVPAHITVD